MYYVIVNPGSGSYHNKTWECVSNILKKHGEIYQVFYSNKKYDVNHILKDLQHGQMIKVLLIGGDGTINLAVNAINDFKQVKIGYIPSGSGNDFGRSMGIIRDTELVMSSILRKGYRLIDVAQVKIIQGDHPQTRRFMISCGLGYDALAGYHVQKSPFKSRMNKYGMGNLVYLASGAFSMFQYKPFHFVDNKEEVAFYVAMNQRYEGGGFLFAPNANPQDGLLDFMKVSNISRLKMLQLIPSARNGKHIFSKHVSLEALAYHHLEMVEPVYIHADGEVLGKAIEVEFSILKDKLCLLNSEI